MTRPEALPIPDYDHLLLSELEHRLEGLDARSLDRLIEHERTYAARPAAIALLQRRRDRLREPPGTEPPEPAQPRR